jgi:NADPH:quinone reductase-like Zn-dependent oxidoreductase
MQTAMGRMGGYAEYIAIDERALAAKPANISHQEAAAVPCAALTAHGALSRIARAGAGSRITVVGGSGGVGTYATQLAKALGATVTAVTSTGNVPLLESLGADRVIDYKNERFASVVRNQDAVFDTIGKESLASCRPALARGGRYITTIPDGRTALQATFSGLLRRVGGDSIQTAHVVLVQASGAHLETIASLMSKGQIRSVIDTVYPLSEARAAHEKSRSWRTRGKLVLAVR